MRINFLIRALSVGGAEKQLSLLADGLCQRNHDCTIITFYGDKAIRPKQASLQVIGKKGRYDFFWFIYRLFRVMGQNNPQIIHGYLTVSNILVCVLKLFFKQTKIVIGVRASNMNWGAYGFMAVLLSKLEKWLSLMADLIIVNSMEGLKHLLKQGYKEAKIHVIENGIDASLYKPNPVLKREYREKWKIPEGRLVFGLVGRLDPMKGHQRFIEAAGMVKKKGINAIFVIMGSGPEGYLQDMKNLTIAHKINDRFIFEPGMNPVPYSAFDILCSASLFGEGFSNVVCEAMASGVPCVVTDVGDSGRIVGDLGEVIEPNNPHSLAEAMITLSKKLTPELSHNCRSRIVDEFSLEKMIEKTEALIEKLIND